MLKKFALVATVFALVPTVTLAGGCPHGSYGQVQSCAPGTAWDADTKTCETVVSS